ncbi:MAG: two-component system NtrC family sensor kinase [Mariniblastus sp.]|jgi:two-component system NtrC family sensor kinase
MYFGVIMLLIIVTVLSAASFQGVMKFRKLTKSVRERSLELPEAAKLGRAVSDVRSTLWQITLRESQNEEPGFLDEYSVPTRDQFKDNDPLFWRLNLIEKIQIVEGAFEDYRSQLDNNHTRDPRMAEKDAELQFVADFSTSLDRIRADVDDPLFHFHPFRNFAKLEKGISSLQERATKIPEFMQIRMESFAETARTEYHAWMTFSALLGCSAIGMIGWLMLRFRSRIIRPLETLVEGSRQVANGNFDYRIELNTDDEVAELGDALNAMTANFQEINSDLNRQVQQRTKEVVRSEKMASVGFLAAGVAHEINNPLASIAWSAESLESRIHDILNPEEGTDQETIDTEIADMKKYLRRIQDEAFRCKGITAGLLDFSRMGDVKKVSTNLSEIVDSVIGMVKPLSKYRGRNIEFNSNCSIVAVVNEQEMKQVALNLITNALGSIDEGGTVKISLSNHNGNALLTVTDDGCGMTEEVRQHLFEPFFTRRRNGQGTGLGLSITYQIIEEHGGRITAHSAGPGQGSLFTVSLPLVEHEQKRLAKSA